MLALWLGAGLIASASEAPPVEIKPEVSWPDTRLPIRPYTTKRETLDDVREAIRKASEPEVSQGATDLAKPEYTGPSAREIANAALLEASRRLAAEIAAKEQARLEAEATAQVALADAQRQAELTAKALRRAQDEEALIALLLAM